MTYELVFFACVDDHFRLGTEGKKFNELVEKQDAYKGKHAHRHGRSQNSGVGDLSGQVLVEIEYFDAIANLALFFFVHLSLN